MNIHLLHTIPPEHFTLPFAREILANSLCVPSYVSLETALSYYSMIPERVETITSVTTLRSRTISTPAGTFGFKKISAAAFNIGVNKVDLGNNRHYLIATPEKALADKLVTDRGTGIRSLRELKSYLLDFLRIDPNELYRLNPTQLEEIAGLYHSHKVKLLVTLINRETGKRSL